MVKKNGWYLQWDGAMFLIFSTGFAKKLVGMGLDGFCQAISLHLQLIIVFGLKVLRGGGRFRCWLKVKLL